MTSLKVQVCAERVLPGLTAFRKRCVSLTGYKSSSTDVQPNDDGEEFYNIPDWQETHLQGWSVNAIQSKSEFQRIVNLALKPAVVGKRTSRDPGRHSGWQSATKVLAAAHFIREVLR
jgi:hypothetical protein